MPGTVIRERTQRVARALPTDTGVFFLVGPSEKGREQAETVRNMAEFEQYLGSRQTNSLAYDMAEAFFQEGGSTLHFSRLMGPAPVRASANLLDVGAAVSLVAKAKSPGSWGNAYNVGVVAGDAAGEFKIRITNDAGTYDETSPSFVDQAAAIQWSTTHLLVDLELGVSTDDPAVVAPVSLSGGTDDFANISDATALTALNRFNKEMGPGQVAFAGRTTFAAHTQLRDHALANNRVALYDPPDTTSKATLISTVAQIKGLANGRIGALFAPWVEIPGLLPGTSGRPIPPSAVVAGILGRNDGAGLSPNKPAAGNRGLLGYANKLRATFSKADSDELNEASVNVLRNVAGSLKIYGWRSGTSKITDPLNWQFGNIRLFMAIAAQADNILERYVFEEIDGRGLLFKQLQGELAAMLDTFGDSLYGDTPEERYYIDVDTVNTPTTIRNGEIHAAIELTMSSMGETVILDLVKRQITS